MRPGWQVPCEGDSGEWEGGGGMKFKGGGGLEWDDEALDANLTEENDPLFQDWLGRPGLTLNPKP